MTSQLTLRHIKDKPSLTSSNNAVVAQVPEAPGSIVYDSGKGEIIGSVSLGLDVFSDSSTPASSNPTSSPSTTSTGSISPSSTNSSSYSPGSSSPGSGATNWSIAIVVIVIVLILVILAGARRRKKKTQQTQTT